jgi:DNA-directed RNA polymerase subunit K/omega
MDREIPVQGLLDDARNIEERVREAFERAHSMALPAPDSDDDEDDIPMVF